MMPCNHCGGDIFTRNPSSYCDHLYYPDSCAVCRGDHGLSSERVRDADVLAEAARLVLAEDAEHERGKSVGPAWVALRSALLLYDLRAGRAASPTVGRARSGGAE